VPNYKREILMQGLFFYLGFAGNCVAFAPSFLLNKKEAKKLIAASRGC